MFGDINLQVSKAMQVVWVAQNDIATLGFSKDKFEAEKTAQFNLDDLFRKQEMLLRDKCRMRWLQCERS